MSPPRCSRAKARRSRSRSRPTSTASLLAVGAEKAILRHVETSAAASCLKLAYVAILGTDAGFARNESFHDRVHGRRSHYPARQRLKRAVTTPSNEPSRRVAQTPPRAGMMASRYIDGRCVGSCTVRAPLRAGPSSGELESMYESMGSSQHPRREDCRFSSNRFRRNRVGSVRAFRLGLRAPLAPPGSGVRILVVVACSGAFIPKNFRGEECPNLAVPGRRVVSRRGRRCVKRTPGDSGHSAWSIPTATPMSRRPSGSALRSAA